MNCRFLTTERLIVRSFMKKPQQTPINFLKSTHSSLSRSISYRSGGRPPFLKSFAFQNIIKPGIFTFAGIGATYTFFILKQEFSFERAINKYPEYFKKLLRYFNGNWNLAWKSYLEARGTDKNDFLYPIKSKWYSISDYNRTMIPLIGLNLLVFLLWKIPRFEPMMMKYFFCRPTTSHYTSIFLSSFSHMDGWHIACNMISLYSIGSIVFNEYGSDHFLAFYLSSCFFSGYLSYLFKFVSKTVGVGSLGASGACYAVLAAMAFLRPDAHLSIMILPFFSFSSLNMLLGISLFELFCLLRFHMGFDNAAHLAGIIYGSLYNNYISPQIWTKYRHFLVSKVRSLTNFDYNLSRRISKKKK